MKSVRNGVIPLFGSLAGWCLRQLRIVVHIWPFILDQFRRKLGFSMRIEDKRVIIDLLHGGPLRS